MAAPKEKNNNLAYNEVDLTKEAIKDKDLVYTEVELTEYEETVRKKYIRKVDFRILPIIYLLYFASALDRGNISAAYVSDLLDYLKVSDIQQANMTTLFTVFYIVFQAPANMLLKNMRPSLWFGSIAIMWSIFAMLQAIAKTATILIIFRCGMGLFEAGLTPGIVAYMPYCFIVGTPVASAIISHQIGKFARYKALFLIEGGITFVVGLLLYILVQDYPDKAKFFTPEEKELAVRRISASQGLASQSKTSVKQTIAALADWKIYVYSIIFFANNNLVVVAGYFGPSIFTSMGYNSTQSVNMGLLPGAAGFVGTIIAFFTVKKYPLFLQIIANVVLSAVGTAMFGFGNSNVLRLSGLLISSIFNNTNFPLIVVWVSVNCGSVPKRMVSMAILFTISGAAGIVTPYFFTRSYAPKYTSGFIFATALMVLSVVLCLVMKIYFDRVNKHRLANPTDVSHMSTKEQQDLNDNHPNFIYTC
ncbi:hypothetical protein BB558_005136 [Smittium angustum]|uniref:Major facilitator superfamily (MFS) profile domain-containing protein n=1 Tax=Smittium angustum TaxID=133377 RepID=A0A2U1J1D8_SMIAN|nr:hypothetical protein BB558_005136 [Smittium angustum]